jgi:nucleoside-diphosphate-sugar epimerase
VLGLGYVGLTVALTCAEDGFRVVGIDSDPDRVRVLREAAVDGPEVFPLSSALRAVSLAVTHDAASLGRADAVFICVPTPLEDGEARHEAVRACAATFARHGRPDALVILESTVRPGFVEELRALLGHGGRVELAYAPERIDPQRSQEGMRLREIPRLVAGVSAEANVFGPRKDPAGAYAAVVPRFVEAALDRRSPVIHGDGSFTRDFNFVDNVVHAVRLSLDAPDAGGAVVNVACGGRVSVLDLWRAIAGEAGFDGVPRFGPPRTGDMPHSQADIGEARRLLGFEPVVSFDEGIRLTMAWFRAQRAGVAA